MKVLHVNKGLVGGAAVASLDLHLALLRQGCESYYLVLNEEDADPDKNIYAHRRIYKTLWNKLWFLKLKAFWVNWRNKTSTEAYREKGAVFSYPYSTYNLLKDPLYKSCDLVHFHWPSNFVDFTTFFRKNKKATLWTLHDRFPFQGLFHLNINTDSFLTENRWKEKKTTWYSENKVAFVSPSERQSQHAIKSGVLSPKYIHQIPNGIDPKIYFPLSTNSKDVEQVKAGNKKNILVVSAFIDSKEKKIDDLYDLARNLTDYNFTIVGKKSTSLDLANLSFTDYISNRDQLNRLYNSSDFVLSLSEEESFGLTIVESLFAGTPVLAKKTGVFDQIIQNGLNGFIYRDTNELFNLLKSATEVSWNQSQISANAQQAFNIASVAEKHMDLYKSML